MRTRAAGKQMRTRAAGKRCAHAQREEDEREGCHDHAADEQPRHLVLLPQENKNTCVNPGTKMNEGPHSTRGREGRAQA